MVETEAERRAAIRRAVLDYVAKHPRASDALAGICAWWLPKEGVIERAGLVEEVLDALVEEHQLRRVRLADGTLIYSGPEPDRQD